MNVSSLGQGTAMPIEPCKKKVNQTFASMLTSNNQQAVGIGAHSSSPCNDTSQYKYLRVPKLSDGDLLKRDYLLNKLVAEGILKNYQADLIRSGLYPVSAET